MHLKSAYFYFVLIHLELKTINTFVHVRSRRFLENHTWFQTKLGKVFSDHQNGPQTLPFGAANTYMADIREYPPPPGSWPLLWLLETDTMSKMGVEKTIPTESIEAHLPTPRYGQYLTHAHNHITRAVAALTRRLCHADEPQQERNSCPWLPLPGWYHTAEFHWRKMSDWSIPVHVTESKFNMAAKSSFVCLLQEKKERLEPS